LHVEEFNKALEGLARVHNYFADSLPRNKFERLEPLSIGGELSMACHTRYFQARRQCPSAIPFPFGLGVDPNGDLERMMGCSYMHTEDNVVQYLGKTSKEECPVK
jgi:hypothetical protein